MTVSRLDRLAASAEGLPLHPRIRRRVERYRQFYASNRPGDLLIVIRPRWVKKKDLFEYDFENGGHLAMAADMLASSQAMLVEGGDRDDDLIPWLSPDFGIAIHHTFLVDLPVTFAEWTSWADHPLAGENGYTRLTELRFDPANRWVRRNREMLEFWQAHNDGSCLLNTHMHFGPLDFANALRGNELLTDFYDYPNEVAALLDVCTDAVIALEDHLRGVCGNQIEQVGMPFWGALAPPGSVYVSEDAMDMSGPALSEQWGLPWTSRIRERFGGLAVHHHMLGCAVHGVVGRLARHSIVQISNDPNCPPAISCLGELFEASGDNALMLEASPDEILAQLNELKKGRAILICPCADPTKASQVVDAVRSVSNIGGNC